ncbi:MAG: hypothetical protein U1E37_09910 [Sphingomonadaceae bacterium]
MKHAARNIAFAAALATLALVAMTEGSGPALAAPAAACAVSPPADLALEPQRPAGPDASPSAAATTAPQAVITISGTDRAAAPAASGTLPAEFPKPCDAKPAAARKAVKTRSNIQNN